MDIANSFIWTGDGGSWELAVLALAITYGWWFLLPYMIGKLITILGVDKSKKD